MDLASLGATHPIGELHVVGDGRTEHNDTDVFWEHDEGFLPDHSSLLVVDVVHLVEYHPLDVADHVGTLVEAVSQNFCCHNHTTRFLVEGDITSHDTHRAKLAYELAVLLIRQGLDRGSINDLTLVLHGQSNPVLSDYGLTCRGVGCYEHTFLFLKVQDSAFLERIQFEGILNGELLFGQFVVEVRQIGLVLDCILEALMVVAQPSVRNLDDFGVVDSWEFFNCGLDRLLFLDLLWTVVLREAIAWLVERIRLGLLHFQLKLFVIIFSFLNQTLNGLVELFVLDFGGLVFRLLLIDVDIAKYLFP